MKFLMLMVLIAISLVLNSVPAFAVDTDKCPDTIAVEITNISAFKKSGMSKNLDWVAARDALASSPTEVRLNYEIASRTRTMCEYTEVSGATAKLFSISQYDAEDGKSYKSDRLLVQFAAAAATFNLFPDVESYDVNAIRLYSQNGPQRSRIRTRLTNENGRTLNYEVGLAHIKTE